MVLAVDVGNTTIAAALFEKGEIVSRFRLLTHGPLDFSPYLSGLGIEMTVISSVVPSLARRLLSELERYNPVLVTRELVFSMDLGCYDLSNLGIDRLVDLLAARELAGAPVAVFDLGTCLTVSVLGRDGKFLGGLIAPGAQISLSALHKWTATLPQVEAGPCERFIGQDTKECMLSGVVAGAASMIDGFIWRLEDQLGRIPAVVTGGTASFTLPWVRSKVLYEPDLLLKGLCLVSSRLR